MQTCAQLQPPARRASVRVRTGRVCAGAVASMIALTALACAGGQTADEQRAEQADLHFRLATGYFHEGQVDLTVRELTHALEAQPNHADAHYLFGFVLFGRKEFELAADHFRLALKTQPSFFAARNHLGATLIELERWRDAITVLEPLLREPTYTTPYLVHNNLGWAWLKLGGLAKADEHLRMAVFLNPEFCNGHRNLGLLALQRRDPAAAVEHMTEATRRCPQFAELHLQRAEALQAAGRLDDAQAALRRCVELAGDSQLGRRCRTRLGPAATGKEGGDHARLLP
ncbi:MAG: tetratricopeptide repeat protein [Myxococcota bacterium]